MLEVNLHIGRQDMHLLVGGLCIGTRNFRQYLAFNVAASVLAFYVLTVSITLVLKSKRYLYRRRIINYYCCSEHKEKIMIQF